MNYEGSEAELVTGRKIQLIEDYAVAHEALWPQPTPFVPSVGVGSLLDSVTPTAPQAPKESPIEDTPEPLKKAPGKKAAPKAATLANPANKSDDAADISDSVPQAEEATQDQTDAAS